MKLYYAKGACSLAVKIVINEIGVACEYEAVDIHHTPKKTASGKNFIEINPKGEVPTLLLDNGDILTENAVIQQYLAEKYDCTRLLPHKDDFLRYRVLEALNFVSSDLHKSFSPLFNQAISLEIKQSIFIPILKKNLDYMEHHFEHHPFWVGDSFTLPDGYTFVLLGWLAGVGIELSEWPNLLNYFNLIKERPAVQKSLKDDL